MAKKPTGIQDVPKDVMKHLEYREELTKLGKDMFKKFSDSS